MSRVEPAIVLSTALMGVGAIHVSEDFAYGAADRIGVPVLVAATIFGFWLTFQVLGLLAIGRGHRAGYLMTAAIGLSWTIVAIAEHVADLIGPNLYRSGLLSKALEAAVILLGAAVFVISARGSRFAGARHP